MKYQVNKGIGASIDYKGLPENYLYLIVGVVVVAFLFFIIGMLISLPLKLVLLGFTGILVGGGYIIYMLSHKYGEHGLTKWLIKRFYFPHYVTNRKPICRILRDQVKP